ncbi:MAG: hypothetical protein HS111_14070 [Kofleriaceae bacterium]|nr:hypothetical protein [Kofleriaceae bacterium]MCL4227550.1 hypothetical protein [Myxococcales bacterium]
MYPPTRLPGSGLLVSLPLALAVIACGGGDDGEVTTTRSVLAHDTTFLVAGVESSATLHAELRRAGRVQEADVAVAVTSGDLAAHVDGAALVVDGLTVTFGDIALPLEIFPSDLTLTGIGVHLAAPLVLPAYWTDDDEAATSSGPGRLRLDWSLRIDGQVYPLGEQELGDLGFELAVHRDGPRLRFDLAVLAHGVMWSWADIIALGDLELEVTAYALLE